MIVKTKQNKTKNSDAINTKIVVLKEKKLTYESSSRVLQLNELNKQQCQTKFRDSRDLREREKERERVRDQPSI